MTSAARAKRPNRSALSRSARMATATRRGFQSSASLRRAQRLRGATVLRRGGCPRACGRMGELGPDRVGRLDAGDSLPEGSVGKSVLIRGDRGCVHYNVDAERRRRIMREANEAGGTGDPYDLSVLCRLRQGSTNRLSSRSGAAESGRIGCGSSSLSSKARNQLDVQTIFGQERCGEYGNSRRSFRIGASNRCQEAQARASAGAVATT